MWTEKGGRTGPVQVATGATVQFLLSVKVCGSVSSGGFLESFCFNRPLFEKKFIFHHWLVFNRSIFKSMLPLRAVAFLFDVQPSAGEWNDRRIIIIIIIITPFRGLDSSGGCLFLTLTHRIEKHLQHLLKVSVVKSEGQNCLNIHMFLSDKIFCFNPYLLVFNLSKTF